MRWAASTSSRERVKFAGARVSFDGGVELLGIKGLEPGTKPRQLAWGELPNGFSDILGGCHGAEHSIHMGSRKERAAADYAPLIRRYYELRAGNRNPVRPFIADRSGNDGYQPLRLSMANMRRAT